MKILFVQPLPYPQMGIMILTALAKANGHEVDVAIGPDNFILKKIYSYKPDILGFTVMSGFERRFLRICKLVKENNSKITIIFGGPHSTFFPDIIKSDFVDIGVRGEGEGALIDILSTLEHGGKLDDILNILIKRNGDSSYIMNPLRRLVDLDSIPFADRNIYNDYSFIANSPISYFYSGRGCPYNCSFCFNQEYKHMTTGLGPYVRHRSVTNLIDEISFVVKRKRVRRIMFIDDTFILNKEWLFQFCNSYKSQFKMPFYCNLRADLITDEIVQALKEAGCEHVSFGIESANACLRNELLNKKISDEDIYRSATILNKHHLPFFTTNMLGLPGEKMEDALRTLTLNLEIGTVSAWTSIYQPFPGTALAKYCLEKGLLNESDLDMCNFDTHGTSVLNQPDISKIVRLQKYMYLLVRFPCSISLIKKLINYDMESINKFIHGITYLFFYHRKVRNLNLFETIKEGITYYFHDKNRY